MPNTFLKDFDAFNAKDGKAENWVIDFTKALREHLPKGEYILTHARESSHTYSSIKISNMP